MKLGSKISIGTVTLGIRSLERAVDKCQAEVKQCEFAKNQTEEELKKKSDAESSETCHITVKIKNGNDRYHELQFQAHNLEKELESGE